MAESFERIHRSNLVGMGILPLRFDEGGSADSIGLTGEETFAVRGLVDGLRPRMNVTIEATSEENTVTAFPATVMVENQAEIDCLHAGGVLPMVLAELRSS